MLYKIKNGFCECHELYDTRYLCQTQKKDHICLGKGRKKTRILKVSNAKSRIQN